MPERWSSFFILAGGVLLVLVLWYLSYRFVRWDTGRQGMRPMERKMWIAAAVVLPLFGCALYLFRQVSHRYLVPPASETGVSTGNTDILAPRIDLRKENSPVSKRRNGQPLNDGVGQEEPTLEPAWGSTYPARSNGKSHAYATPETIRSPYQAVRAQYSLMVIQGPHQGQQFLVTSLPLRIGRGAEAGIALDADLNVSRKHAEIYEWNSRLRIRDLGSTHGTAINGVTANDQALSPGDQITVGETVLILRELP